MPDFATAHLVRARVRVDRGDERAARDAYHRVLRLDPDNTAALREAASLARDGGDPTEALRLYQRLATVAGPDQDVAGRIRELKHARFGLETPVPPPGEHREEEHAGEPPREDEPEPGVYTRTLGELYARQGHARRALDVYRKLVERSPEDPSLRARMEEIRAGLAAVEEPAAATGSGGEEPDHIEVLAREWGGPHEKQHTVTSPFTWGDDEADETGASPDAAPEEGPSIASYFDELLSGGGSAGTGEGGADVEGAGGAGGRA